MELGKFYKAMEQDKGREWWRSSELFSICLKELGRALHSQHLLSNHKMVIVCDCLGHSFGLFMAHFFKRHLQRMCYTTNTGIDVSTFTLSFYLKVGL